MKWISIFFLLVNFYSQAQENKPWEIGCDTMVTQTDMNICSYESYQIADSVLQDLFQTLIDKKQSILDRMLKMDENERSEKIIQSVKVQVESLRSMKKNFNELRAAQMKLVGLQYEGGSMRPLVENSTGLRMTVEQINLLYDTLEEIEE